MNLQTNSSSVVIVGSGLASLYCALNLDSSIDITIITDSIVKNSNSYLAQGGIAISKSKDDINSHIEDTLKAGGYENSIDAVKILTKESNINLNCLFKLGVTFDNENGKLLFTKEAAHSTNRIVHCNDHTGKSVIDTLLIEINKRKNINIIEKASLVDLLINNNLCTGLIYYKDSKLFIHNSKKVILATGGIGGLFKNSTNFNHMKGISIYLALKHNIKLMDTQYVQFHPTAFFKENSERLFLLSESLRGEGAILKNIYNSRFTNELLPRNPLTKIIRKELKNTNSSFVFLDISHRDSTYIKNRFPLIYSKLLLEGLDLTKDSIPVAPAQHYFMGGIAVDLNSKTSISNLYAIGETSCTGVHGNNRLASNSLLESLVFGRRAAIDINKNICNTKLLTSLIHNHDFNIDYFNEEVLKTLTNYFKDKGEFFKNELVFN